MSGLGKKICRFHEFHARGKLFDNESMIWKFKENPKNKPNKCRNKHQTHTSEGTVKDPFTRN